MELSDLSETNGSIKPKAVLASGAALHSMIQELAERGAPIYEPAVRATDHKGYIGLVYEDCCIQRFSVDLDNSYRYVTRSEFMRSFRGRQLACL